jgi:hypothetical protein
MKSLFAAFLLLAGSVVALAQTSSVPTLLSYQAHVTDASGVAIGNSTPVNRTVTFKFYNASTGGTLLYAESQTVTLSGGDFSALIGNGTGLSGLPGPSTPATITSLSSIFAGTVYLGLTVDDGTSAADPEISPRQQIVSAAYAFRAKVAESLATGALSTAMLADTAVTTDKIGAAQVTTAKIANLAVTTTALADANVTTAKLGDASVTTVKLADTNVTTAKLADSAVTTAKIAAGAVTSASLAANSVASIHLVDGGVATADLADNAVTTGKIANNAVDLGKLIAAVQQSLCPTGTILAFAGDAAPPGWQLCDSTFLNRTTYAALFAVVGTRFGYGDSTNFRVPDFRGRFLRGRDGGVGLDPDRAARTAMNAGGAVGDLVGSVQGDMFAAHNHSLPLDGQGGPYDLPTINNTSGADENWSFAVPTGTTGGTETRPKNANVNFIIKL